MLFMVGERVQITPRDEFQKVFWQYVAGWHGTVVGHANGLVQVKCYNPDPAPGHDPTIELTFFVQPENLTKTSGR